MNQDDVDNVMAADADVEIYRHYDDNYVVRSMKIQDAAVVQKWFHENMGVTSQHDLYIALSSLPSTLKGFYVGEFEGRVVASAVSLPWGDDVCYASYYYVDEPYRGRGFGTRLRDQVAWGHLSRRMLCLDAVIGPVAKKNEEKFGYRPSFLTGFFEAVAFISRIPTNSSITIVQINEIPFQSLIAYDNRCFVSRDFAPRRKFLQQWTQIPGGETFVALNDVTGHVIGYGCRRPSMKEAYHKIGPLYADDPDVAESLLISLSRDVAGDTIAITSWLQNKDAQSLMTKYGFVCVAKVQHMHANGNPNEFKPEVYAITSVDVCGF